MTYSGPFGGSGTTVGRQKDSPSGVDVNLAAGVAHNAKHRADAIAIRAEGEDICYRDLDARVSMLAAALASDGVTTGDRIAYLGLNSPAFFVTLLAAFRLGAIFVPVNFRLAGPELVRVLNASGANPRV